jgi:hypothetical protein
MLRPFWYPEQETLSELSTTFTSKLWGKQWVRGMETSTEKAKGISLCADHFSAQCRTKLWLGVGIEAIDSASGPIVDYTRGGRLSTAHSHLDNVFNAFLDCLENQERHLRCRSLIYWNTKNGILDHVQTDHRRNQI